MSEQWNTDLFKFLIWLAERTSPKFHRNITQYADQYRKEHPWEKMKLYRITLDQDEENFYVIAKNRYDALGHLIKSNNGITEDCIGRLDFWGETEAKEGTVLS